MHWYFPISALINAVTSTLLGFFLLHKNYRARINRYFFYFCASVAAWSYCYFAWQLSTSYDLALFWSKALMFGAIFTSLSYFHLVLVFLHLDKLRKYRIILIIFYSLAFLWVILNFTPYFVKSVEPRSFFNFWPTPGVFYTPFLLTFFAHVIYASILLFKAVKRSTGITRLQTILMLTGLAVAFVGGSTNYFLWYNIPIPPYGNILVTVYVILTAYSILKYRFLNILLVIKRSTIFTLLVVTLTAIYAFLVIFLSQTFGHYLGKYSLLITSVVTSILIVLGFQPLKTLLQRATSRYLFKEDYDPQEVIADLAETLASSIELEHLFDGVERIVEKAFHPTKQAVCLLGKDKEFYRLARAVDYEREKTNELNFSLSDPLVQYFKTYKEILVLPELERKIEAGVSQVQPDLMEKLIKRLKKTNGQVFAPLFSKENLIGIFILGEKKSGDVYNIEDIRLLEISSSQAAVAIENAQMYEEVKGFTVTLKEEVERATKELRIANRRLKKLDQAKSEFISIASHQLRTPLTVIKGYISMMLEGSFGQLTASEIDSLHKVYDSNQRLINLVEDLLNVSRIESGRMQYNLRKTQIEDIVESVVEEILPNAQKKKLYLEYIAPQEKLPKIRVDNEKLRQVFINLVDNAVKYTKKGGVRIYLNQKDNNIILKVADSGIGIDPEDMTKLFMKFSRGKGVNLVHTEGTGLGLFVAKEIIKAHQGKIWVESPGKDKGSTFFVNLPIEIKKPKKKK